MRNAGLDEAQAGVKIAGRNADDTTLMAESEEELKSLLMKVEENEKAGLSSTFRKLRSWHLTHHHQIGFIPEMQGSYFMGNRWGNCYNSVRLYFGGLQKSLQMVIAAIN